VKNRSARPLVRDRPAIRAANARSFGVVRSDGRDR
jgi:hypothetical protein